MDPLIGPDLRRSDSEPRTRRDRIYLGGDTMASSTAPWSPLVKSLRLSRYERCSARGCSS